MHGSRSGTVLTFVSDDSRTSSLVCRVYLALLLVRWASTDSISLYPLFVLHTQNFPTAVLLFPSEKLVPLTVPFASRSIESTLDTKGG